MNTLKKQKQVNKSSQQKGFFAAHGLCPANRAEPRAGIFCPAAPALASASAKVPMP
jgi:hypothetical protein